ncbi:MAG TPA: hypothetical protein PLQ44_03460 [Candidatus Paceibacterota bacterium]|nr:hypothetical protein [Candidatus Paceibacterota bacterium]
MGCFWLQDASMFVSFNKSINQGFDDILIVFGHLFNGFKLVKEFLIGKGIFYEIIGVTVHQKIGSNFEGIG